MPSSWDVPDVSIIFSKRHTLSLQSCPSIDTLFHTGVLQEKMAIKKYGLLGARFPHLNALVGVQSMACFLWAGVLLLVFPPAKGEHVAPITAYWLPGLTNSVGPALGFQALKNISYPAQASFGMPPSDDGWSWVGLGAAGY